MKNLSISGVKNYLLWCIFVFILIYAPPLIPYIHVLLGVIVFLIMLFGKNHIYLAAFRESDMWLWTKFMMAVFLYALLIPFPLSAFYNDIVDLPHYYHLFNRFAVLVFMEVTCGTFLIARFQKKNYSFEFFLNVLIGVALFQSFLGCLAIAVPGIKEIFLAFMIKMGGLSTENEGVIVGRTFGFAGSMLDQFGFGTGLIAGLSFFWGVKNKSRYIIYSLIIMIASVLNARSGIVIYAISICLTIFFSIFINHNVKMILKSLAFIVIIPTIFISSIEIISTYNEFTGEWLNKGVNSVIEFITTGSSNQDNMNIISSERFWQLPDAGHILIGTGHSRYLAEGYLHTDCGIVNDIWFVGIIGLLLLYGVVFYICYKIYRNSTTSFEKYLAFFFICAFCVFDVKAASIGYNMGGAVFFLVLFVTRFYQKMNQRKV